MVMSLMQPVNIFFFGQHQRLRSVIFICDNSCYHHVVCVGVAERFSGPSLNPACTTRGCSTHKVVEVHLVHQFSSAISPPLRKSIFVDKLKFLLKVF
jgi:hypothetical protein